MAKSLLDGKEFAGKQRVCWIAKSLLDSKEFAG
jgi:hypothetical protein